MVKGNSTLQEYGIGSHHLHGEEGNSTLPEMVNSILHE